MSRLVLASTSPYRRSALERLGLPFETVAPDIDETPHANERPQALARRLSQQKARAVTAQFPQHLIIGSDQTACLDGKILGKPGNLERAVEQLASFSGRTVEFFSGLCLFNSEHDRVQTDVVITRVYFRELDQASILNYIRDEPAYDCVGAFKSEGKGIRLCAKIESDDPNALIGLPLIRLVDMLRKERLL